MATDQSELSSLASLLDQLSHRAAAMGERARAEKEEAVAHELFQVERAIDGARRRLKRLLEHGP